MITLFANIIVGSPLPTVLTYRVPRGYEKVVLIGMRVLVPLGRRGLVTGVVQAIHEEAPTQYQAKYIEGFLDKVPVLDAKGLQFWQWIWEYYLCAPGDVLNTALPPTLKLRSETFLYTHTDVQDRLGELNADEMSLFQYIQGEGKRSLQELRDALNSHDLQHLKGLIANGFIAQEEQIKEKYSEKTVPYIESNNTEEQWKSIFDLASRAPKQLDFIQQYISESKAFSGSPVPIPKIPFCKQYGFSDAVVRALVEKEVISIVHYQTNRIPTAEAHGAFPELSDFQAEAYEKIREHLATSRPVLFHGVTGSGKTEVYIHLIAEAIARGQQVLLLLPEIGISTQLIQRFQAIFGDEAAVFHSKFSANERHETWEAVQSGEKKLVVGPRSTLFMPFRSLGLIVVDEEHEQSHKQNLKSPRLHGRDAAFQLANIHGAKFVMGTASPSLESLVGVANQKIEYVALTKRYGGLALPEILTADLKADNRKKKMKGIFSEMLFTAIEQRLIEGKQILLYQNRRGYAPVLICEDCGNHQQCSDCDVNLTYHQHLKLLRCHLCGNTYRYEAKCRSCSSTKMQYVGHGTEQIEEEVKKWFPKARVLRVDHDTTRGKKSLENIITTISKQECDIIVGTQMIAKGFDFANIDLVGIINGDQFFNQSDFRAEERAFHQVIQVAGRSGRKDKRGTAIVQTFQPYHPIFRLAMLLDTKGFYKQEVIVRKNHGFPPFVRFIKIEMSFMKRDVVDNLSQEMARMLRQHQFIILGPTSPPIERVRNNYHRIIIVKLSKNEHLNQRKNKVKNLCMEVQKDSKYRRVRLTLDVDP